ncbi:MAG: thymidylate kinase [Planctomycetaceae bacterium]
MTLLIAIEGIDGAGKGTQSRRLTERLYAVGRSATCIQFPRYTDTHFGAAIGDYLNGRFGLLNEVHPQLAAVLYAGDRYESKNLLLESMASHDVVVLDRFVGSNLAHQAAKLQGEDRTRLLAWIETIEHDVFQLPRPALNILIDISAGWSRTLVGRKGQRDYTDAQADIHESDLTYLEDVRQCYVSLAASRDDWCVVNSLSDDGQLRGVDEIADEIFGKAAALL